VCRFPEGEWQSYKDDNLWRETSAEMREKDRLQADMINDVRQAAEVHRQVSDVCWPLEARGGGGAA
jgi:methionyl aminopeptidase